MSINNSRSGINNQTHQITHGRSVRVGDRSEGVTNRRMVTQVIEMNARSYSSDRVNFESGDTTHTSVEPVELNSNRTTLSPRSYDPENNSSTLRDSDFTQQVNMHRVNQLQSGSRFQNCIVWNKLGINKTRGYGKLFRILVLLLLFILIGTATYWLLVLVVELTDKTLSHSLIISSKPSKNYNAKNSLNGMDNQAELNPVELMSVIEELRKEIQKLKEVSYKNSLAINGLSKGEYKVPGVDENLESAKRSKFGKGSAVVNLNSNGHRQDMKFAKIRDEDSEFVPGIIEYQANITQQS
uniref:Uncharacterized protein n=1 Tax=Theileria annulata TaxID=5874 RepID=A0A3B0MEZ0_THEAN